MTNFEVFCWNISLSINLSFLKSGECQLFCGYECWSHIFQLRPNIFVKWPQWLLSCVCSFVLLLLTLCTNILLFHCIHKCKKNAKTNSLYSWSKDKHQHNLFILNTVIFLESQSAYSLPSIICNTNTFSNIW